MFKHSTSISSNQVKLICQLIIQVICGMQIDKGNYNVPNLQHNVKVLFIFLSLMQMFLTHAQFCTNYVFNTVQGRIQGGAPGARAPPDHQK